MLARIGTALGGYQDYYYTLRVYQKVIVSADLGTIAVNQFNRTFTLPSGSVTVNFMDGTTASFDVAPYVATILAEGNTYAFAETALGSAVTGGWDLSNVDLALTGGTYYGVLYVGNALGGYQAVGVRFKVATKVLDANAPVRYVVSEDASGVTLATLHDVTAGVGEYFTLPTDLWLTMQDGTTLRVNATWHKMSYVASGETVTVEGWTPDDVYAAYKRGVTDFRLYCGVYGQELSIRLTLSALRVVKGDDFAAYYSVRRGSAVGLPTTITQSVYVLTEDGTQSVVSTTFDIVWNVLPRLNITDKYVLSASVDGDGVKWTRTIPVYVYNSYVYTFENFVDEDGNATDGTVSVKVGDDVVADILPAVKVSVLYGTMTYDEIINPSWVLVRSVSSDGVVTEYDQNVAYNNFNIRALEKDARYVFRALTIDKNGDLLVYRDTQADLLVTVVVTDKTDLSEKIDFVGVKTLTLLDGTEAECATGVYGSTKGYVPYVLVDSDVEVYRVTYLNKATGKRYVKTLDGGVMIGDAEPSEAGEYTLTVSLRYVGAVEGADVSIDYVIEKKDIRDLILISRTNRIYREEGGIAQPAAVEAAVSGHLADVRIEYKPVGADDAAYTTDAPSAVGKYTVRVTVVSANYTGVKMDTLTIAKAVNLVFHPVGGAAVSTSVGQDSYVTDSTITGYPMITEDRISVWYYVDGEGVTRVFSVYERVSASLIEGNSRVDIYEARAAIAVDATTGIASVTFVYAGEEVDLFDSYEIDYLVGTTSYAVYRNGSYITQPAGFDVNDPALKPGTYTIKVTVFSVNASASCERQVVVA